MKERDDLLDKQSGRYEERLVELHSVIAELTRQLEEKTREHIPEESDEDENSTSLASTSPHEQSKTVSDLASGTSTDIIDAQAVEVRSCSSCSNQATTCFMNIFRLEEGLWNNTDLTIPIWPCSA